MSIELIKKELVYISHKVYAKGYTQATGGQVSCRVPGSEGLFAIKRTAVSMGEMCEGDVLIVDSDGNVVEGAGKPSKEVNFHLGIMKLRKDVNAVVHCHPNYAIGFANCGMSLPLMTVTARKILENVPCIESALAGSQELRQYVIKAFETYPNVKGILMREHGVCAVGATLENAYNMVDLIEGTAKQAYLTMGIANNRSFFETL